MGSFERKRTSTWYFHIIIDKLVGLKAEINQRARIDYSVSARTNVNVTR